MWACSALDDGFSELEKKAGLRKSPIKERGDGPQAKMTHLPVSKLSLRLLFLGKGNRTTSKEVNGSENHEG